ncbi:MAG: Fic family protein [Bifidobacteriaceae bacterium]|jgi:fido (protein-threonine AMPylation protein)|nr:Fic family protein [Bifidobacteriaceae bacterium]
MPLAPGYGETPLDFEELDVLLPAARKLIGDPVTKAAVYDYEEGIAEQVGADALEAVLDGSVVLEEIVSDYYLRDLHRQLYGELWSWAGVLRHREVNIGIAPERITTELRASLDTILYRWRHTEDWTAHHFGIAVHAETVRIHPFVDGNGRVTRLLADPAFAAAQDPLGAELYDWDVDKRRYITLLGRYDQSRDPAELAELVATRSTK